MVVDLITAIVIITAIIIVIASTSAFNATISLGIKKLFNLVINLDYLYSLYSYSYSSCCSYLYYSFH